MLTGSTIPIPRLARSAALRGSAPFSTVGVAGSLNIHSRTQNSGDINDVVALLFRDGGPHYMLVREGPGCISPPVLSLKRTHLLDEHLFIFFVPLHAPV